MNNKDEKFKITPKGIICACLFQHGIVDAVNISEAIWEHLYEYGCDEIGEIGLPALVIEKYKGGAFVPVVRGEENEG